MPDRRLEGLPGTELFNKLLGARVSEVDSPVQDLAKRLWPVAKLTGEPCSHGARTASCASLLLR